MWVYIVGENAAALAVVPLFRKTDRNACVCILLLRLGIDNDFSNSTYYIVILYF